MAGFGLEGYRDRIPCPHCGSTDCCGMDSPDAEYVICIYTHKIVTIKQLERSAKRHGIKQVVKIIKRGNIGSDSAEVYKLKDGRFAIGYQGQDGVHIIRKGSKILKEVGDWIEHTEEVEVI